MVSDALFLIGLNIIYLNSRFQYVSVNNNNCTPLPIKYGVLRGSLLGPLLFILYINDIVNTSILHAPPVTGRQRLVLCYLGVGGAIEICYYYYYYYFAKFILFADDTDLFASIRT